VADRLVVKNFHTPSSSFEQVFPEPNFYCFFPENVG
jgi:hypothetical protein